MEFTEPDLSHDQPSKHEEHSNSRNSEQVIPAMARLENEIDDVYTSIESRLTTFWNSASRNVYVSRANPVSQTDNVHPDEMKPEFDESNRRASLSEDQSRMKAPSSSPTRAADPKIDLASISVSANRALDELDSKLEIVEHKAGVFVNSIASFFSGAVAQRSSPTAETRVEGSSPLPIIPGDAYGSSRYDMELFKLHTTEKFFLDAEFDAEQLNKFIVDDKTQEISNLLKTYSETLAKLMERLVPTQLTYNKFWFVYFRQESKLKDGEKARKKLLCQSDDEEDALVADEDVLENNVKERNYKQENKKVETAKEKGEINEEEGDEDFLWDDEDEEVDTSS